MKGKEFKRFVKLHKFKKVGEIKMLRKNVAFVLDHTAISNQIVENGWVYLWIEKSKGKDEAIVRYVGGTGYTLKKRCNEHQRGCNTPDGGPGDKNGEHIRSTLGKGHQLEIFARLSKRQKVIDEKGMSIFEMEEKALLLKFLREKEPLWNRRLPKAV